MRVYRIREEINEISVINFYQISHNSTNGIIYKIPKWEKKKQKQYIVERRFMWFWWFKSRIFPSTFIKWEDAVHYVRKIRSGKLLYIC